MSFAGALVAGRRPEPRNRKSNTVRQSMKNTELLPIDGQGGAGGESDPSAEAMPLLDWQREVLDRRLDAYARDGNPGRLASIVIDEIRRRRGPLGAGKLFESSPANDASRARENWVLCLDNSDHEASLERHVIYVAIPDPEAQREGLMRVIDETGEDYLYPEKNFAPIRGIRVP
jgi:hypothetical protein